VQRDTAKGRRTPPVGFWEMSPGRDSENAKTKCW